jgi:hypothetical protein
MIGNLAIYHDEHLSRLFKLNKKNWFPKHNSIFFRQKSKGGKVGQNIDED